MCFIRNEFERCGVSSIKSEPEYRQVPLSRHVPQNISRGKASTIVPGNAPGNLNKKNRGKNSRREREKGEKGEENAAAFSHVRGCIRRVKSAVFVGFFFWLRTRKNGYENTRNCSARPLLGKYRRRRRGWGCGVALWKFVREKPKRIRESTWCHFDR